jgi:hypothetical protein
MSPFLGARRRRVNVATTIIATKERFETAAPSQLLGVLGFLAVNFPHLNRG